jgi:hypothetical protein
MSEVDQLKCVGRRLGRVEAGIPVGAGYWNACGNQGKAVRTDIRVVEVPVRGVEAVSSSATGRLPGSSVLECVELDVEVRLGGKLPTRCRAEPVSRVRKAAADEHQPSINTRTMHTPAESPFDVRGGGAASGGPLRQSSVAS